jgi:2-oxoglutarate ferredoxin oxidoreductase subunit beta
MEKAFGEALNRKGFSVVEVISPCPTYYGRANEIGGGLELMRYYKTHSVTKPGANPAEVDIAQDGQIIVGKFVEIEKPWLPMPKKQ